MISVHMSIIGFSCTDRLITDCTRVLLRVWEMFALEMAANVVLGFVREL